MNGEFNVEFADRVADLCYEMFKELPKSGKPSLNTEWTLLSGILKYSNRELEVISLATGSKCIGQSKMDPKGGIINDCHAEVLARRGFVRFVYHEVQRIKLGGCSSIFSYNESQMKYIVNPGVTFHLFTSHMPCGDASIFPKDVIETDKTIIKLGIRQCNTPNTSDQKLDESANKSSKDKKNSVTKVKTYFLPSKKRKPGVKQIIISNVVETETTVSGILTSNEKDEVPEKSSDEQVSPNQLKKQVTPNVDIIETPPVSPEKVFEYGKDQEEDAFNESIIIPNQPKVRKYDEIDEEVVSNNVEDVIETPPISPEKISEFDNKAVVTIDQEERIISNHPKKRHLSSNNGYTIEFPPVSSEQVSILDKTDVVPISPEKIPEYDNEAIGTIDDEERIISNHPKKRHLSSNNGYTIELHPISSAKVSEFDKRDVVSIYPEKITEFDNKAIVTIDQEERIISNHPKKRHLSSNNGYNIEFPPVSSEKVSVLDKTDTVPISPETLPEFDNQAIVTIDKEERIISNHPKKRHLSSNNGYTVEFYPISSKKVSVYDKTDVVLISPEKISEFDNKAVVTIDEEERIISNHPKKRHLSSNNEYTIEYPPISSETVSVFVKTEVVPIDHQNTSSDDRIISNHPKKRHRFISYSDPHSISLEKNPEYHKTDFKLPIHPEIPNHPKKRHQFISHVDNNFKTRPILSEESFELINRIKIHRSSLDINSVNQEIPNHPKKRHCSVQPYPNEIFINLDDLEDSEDEIPPHLKKRRHGTHRKNIRTANTFESPPVSEIDLTVTRSDDVEKFSNARRDNIEKLFGDINRTGAKCLPNAEEQDPKLPGSSYHITGVVRTKPGRGDPTVSLSCSDKIAKWNCTGIQGALLSLIIEPIYLSSIVVGCKTGQFNKESLHRAVIDRIRNVSIGPAGDSVPHVVLLHCNQEFQFSRYRLTNTPLKTSCASLIWCNVVPFKCFEVYVKGKTLGCTKTDAKRNIPILCKKSFCDLFKALTGDKYATLPYKELKQIATEYQTIFTNVKTTLGVWSDKPGHLQEFL